MSDLKIEVRDFPITERNSKYADVFDALLANVNQGGGKCVFLAGVSLPECNKIRVGIGGRARGKFSTHLRLTPEGAYLWLTAKTNGGA